MSVEMEWLGGNDYFAKAPNRAGIKITWIDHGREMKCPADSDYPNGQDIDLGAGAEWTCLTELPYPAPRRGQWKLECQKCGLTALVTAASQRRDRAASKKCWPTRPFGSNFSTVTAFCSPR